jgi:hypothetical protein
MRSIRAKSLLIDFFLTTVPLSHGNDARRLVTRRMGNDHQTPDQQTQRDEPLFAVSKTVVFKGDAGPGKDLFGIFKAEGRVWRCSSGSSPRPIRISFHLKIDCIAFCSYTQGGHAPALKRPILDD